MFLRRVPAAHAAAVSRPLCRWCEAQATVVAATVQQTLLFFQLPTLAPTRQLVGTNDEVIDAQWAGPAHGHVAVATTSEQVLSLP
jgi:hypothetical protein